MLKMALPLPATERDSHAWGASRLGLSKRAFKLILSAALVLVTFAFYTLSYPAGGSTNRIDMAELERILEYGASSTIVGAVNSPPQYEGEGLTSLGLEADESFHLGSVTLSEYRAELEGFVVKAFPTKYQKDALASLQRHLDDSGTQTSFSPIPPKCVYPSTSMRRGC